MARIILGGIVTDIRGKMAGNIFQKGRGVNYVKGYTAPIAKNTPIKNSRQSTNRTLSSTWRNLTPVQQATWATQAPNYPRVDRFGTAYIPAASNLYMWLNSNLLIAGQAKLMSAINPMAITNMGLVVATASTVPSVLVNVAIVGAVNEYMRIEATAGLSRGRKFRENDFKIITHLPYQGVSAFNITTEYVNKWGVPRSGTHIFIRCMVIRSNTGQNGNKIVSEAVIVV